MEQGICLPVPEAQGPWWPAGPTAGKGWDGLPRSQRSGCSLQCPEHSQNKGGEWKGPQGLPAMA